MKILAPLSNVEDFERLVEVGVDEFYCGMVPIEWIEKYGFDLNRREFRSNSALNNLTSLKILKEKSDEFGIQIKITLNSLLYSQGQYEKIAELILKYMDIGFDIYIIADIGLLVYLRERKIPCKVHISGEMPAINSMTIDLLMNYDITRIIFPRRMSIDDMQGCINKYGTALEYESFILNENCMYTGAFCNTIHCDELRNACYLPYNYAVFNTEKRDFHVFYRYLQMMKTCSAKSQIDDKGISKIGDSGCGLCYLHRLKEIGITNLKVVGRGRNIDCLIEDISAVKKALQLTQNYSAKDYKQTILDEFFDGNCKNSYGFCYYPKSKNSN